MAKEVFTDVKTEQGTSYTLVEPITHENVMSDYGRKYRSRIDNLTKQVSENDFSKFQKEIEEDTADLELDVKTSALYNTMFVESIDEMTKTLVKEIEINGVTDEILEKVVDFENYKKAVANYIYYEHANYKENIKEIRARTNDYENDVEKIRSEAEALQKEHEDDKTKIMQHLITTSLAGQ